jgi:hypothetical protein
LRIFTGVVQFQRASNLPDRLRPVRPAVRFRGVRALSVVSLPMMLDRSNTDIATALVTSL